MFNVLISGSGDAWETDQLMRMDSSRFKEFTDGTEARGIEATNPESLRALEQVPALLLYEDGIRTWATDEVRYGRLSNIQLAGDHLVFRFKEEGRFTRATLNSFAKHLSITNSFELNRTHWAIKDAAIPTAMMQELRRSYDVAFSFAGADRGYVEEVATLLRERGVRVFYDSFEQVALWGAPLGEFLADLYDRRARYCVMFISRHYAEREWTTHERRSALDRQIRDRGRYLLPCRFDDTRLDGISSSIGYVPLAQMAPAQLAGLILQKLGL